MPTAALEEIAMNATDTLALLPLLLLAGTAVVVMLGIAVKRSHELTAGLTLTGLAASFLSVCAVAPLVPRQVTSLLLIDRLCSVLPGADHCFGRRLWQCCRYQYFAKHDGATRGTLSAAASGDPGLRGLGDERPFCHRFFSASRS